jgi:hypothetical protein
LRVTVAYTFYVKLTQRNTIFNMILKFPWNFSTNLENISPRICQDSWKSNPEPNEYGYALRK